MKKKNVTKYLRAGLATWRDAPTNSSNYSASYPGRDLLPAQSWTWVTFLWPNPTQ